MKDLNPILSAYMIYVSEEGIDLRRFVERGAHLLKSEDTAFLTANQKRLREKLDDIRAEHPRLERQLEFLAKIHKSKPSTVPDSIRREAAFALLYAIRDMDMMPDDVPGLGFVDDAAVTEVVLSRHAEIFRTYCEDHNMDWTALKPVTSI